MLRVSSDHWIWSIWVSYGNFYPRDAVSAVYATATWLAGWLDVTHRYCIKTAKPILKLSRSSGSPIILVSSDLNTRGWENWRFSTEICLSRKRYVIGRWLLWNVNRKSRVPDWMVSSSMTLSDPNPGFKVTVYLQGEYLKNKVTKEH